MAERNEKVLERVRQELGKNPNLGSRELYESAKQADKAVAADSMQQFHARYVLPIKRELRGPSEARSQKGGVKRRKARPGTATTGETPSAPKRRGRQKRGDEPSERDRVRALLLQFAQELTDAESRSSLVQVLGRVDQYVSRIVPEGR
jgi:hypothetical protein